MSEYGCHIDLPEGQHDNCVLDGGNRDDCIYTRKYGEDGRNKCGEWKPVKVIKAPPSEELAAARALLREVIGPKAGDWYTLERRVEAYFDACDKPGAPDAS